MLLVVTFVVGVAALFFKRIDGGQWVDITKWAVGSYMAANAAEGVSNAFKGSSDGN